MRTLYSPFGEAPEHMQALGEMTVSFADVEGQISQFIWTLLGDDQKVGQIVTAQLSFQRQLDLLGALFRHKIDNGALAKELDQILSKAASAEQERNKLIHSQFIPGTGINSLHRFKATAKRVHGLKVQFERLLVKDINDVTEQLNDVALTLFQFQTKKLGFTLL
jgi:hypothetical protein